MKNVKSCQAMLIQDLENNKNDKYYTETESHEEHQSCQAMLVQDLENTMFHIVFYLIYDHRMLLSLQSGPFELEYDQQNDLCTPQRLRSAWASTQSDQSLCYVRYR